MNKLNYKIRIGKDRYFESKLNKILQLFAKVKEKNFLKTIDFKVVYYRTEK